MFGISPLGWIHTLGSLPAIPAAVYMFVRYGRITPRSPAGIVYLVSMLVGASTVFLVAHQQISYVIAVATLVFLIVGYGAGRFSNAGGVAEYIETVFLTVSAFLLMVPTVTETLRRVPDGDPFVTDLNSPLLHGFHAGLFIMLVVGLSFQIMYLRRKGKAAPALKK